MTGHSHHSLCLLLNVLLCLTLNHVHVVYSAMAIVYNVILEFSGITREFNLSCVSCLQLAVVDVFFSEPDNPEHKHRTSLKAVLIQSL